jgi:hypothetical protein
MTHQLAACHVRGSARLQQQAMCAAVRGNNGKERRNNAKGLKQPTTTKAQ